MKKLSFLELEKEMEVMTEEENFRTKAGGGGFDVPGVGYGPDGFCVFNTMSYLNSYYSDGNKTFLSYFKAYKNEYGTSEIMYAEGGYVLGVETGSGSDYQEFMREHFNIVSENITKTSQIRSFLDDGDVVTAAVGNHNVVIKSYSGNYFTYEDTTTGFTYSKKQGDGTNGTVAFANCLAIDGFKTPTSTGYPTTTIPTTTIPTTTIPPTT